MASLLIALMQHEFNPACLSQAARKMFQIVLLSIPETSVQVSSKEDPKWVLNILRNTNSVKLHVSLVISGWQHHLVFTSGEGTETVLTTKQFGSQFLWQLS